MAPQCLGWCLADACGPAWSSITSSIPWQFDRQLNDRRKCFWSCTPSCTNLLNILIYATKQAFSFLISLASLSILPWCTRATLLCPGVFFSPGCTGSIVKQSIMVGGHSALSFTTWTGSTDVLHLVYFAGIRQFTAVGLFIIRAEMLTHFVCDSILSLFSF